MNVKIKKNGLYCLPIYAVIAVLFVLLGRRYIGTANIAIGVGFLTSLTFVLCTDISVKTDKNKDILLYIVAGVCVMAWLPLAVTENVAYDPGYSVAMVRHSLKDIVELCSYDVHSPLYYFLAKIFYVLFGKHNFGLKMCSLFFMLLFYLMLLFPFKKEFGRRITLYSMLVTAAFPTVITHAAEPRMYAMAFAAFSFVCFTGYMLLKRFKRIDACVFFLASVFCVYIHTYTMIATVFLYLIMAGFIIFGKIKDKKAMLIFFPINSVLVSASYIPWLSVLVSQFAEKDKYNGELQKPAELIGEIIAENFSSVSNPLVWQSVLGMTLLIAMLIVLIAKKSEYLKVILIYAGIFAATSFVGVYLASTNSPCFMGRYVSCASFSLILIIAVGLACMKNQKIAKMFLLAFVFSGLIVYKNEAKLQYDTDGIKAYNEFLDENATSDDAIMYSEIHTDMLSIYHPDIYTFIYGNEDAFNPFDNDEVFRDFDQLEKIQGNLYFVCFSFKDPSMFMNCEYDEIMTFHYMYYDLSLYVIWNFN